MSDRATLRRLLREHAEAVSTEIAFIKEDAILRLFETTLDEENARAEAAEARAERLQAALNEVYSMATRRLGEPRGDDTKTLIAIATVIEAHRARVGAS